MCPILQKYKLGQMQAKWLNPKSFYNLKDLEGIIALHCSSFVLNLSLEIRSGKYRAYNSWWTTWLIEQNKALVPTPFTLSRVGVQ